MRYDFFLHAHKHKGVYQYFCNVNKNDLQHAMDHFIHYCQGEFKFVDYGNYGVITNPHCDMIDYSVLSEAELFQAEVAYNSEYLLTLDEVVAIQRIMKEYVINVPDPAETNDQYFFNIGNPE